MSGGRKGGTSRWRGGPVLLGAGLAAAVIVRLLYLRELPGNPFFAHPIIDAAEYFGWASRLAEDFRLWDRVHIHGPLYPMLLALLMKGGASFGGIYLFQHLLGVATLFLIYDTGRIVAGRTAGMVALALSLLYPRFLYFEGLVLATSIVTFLDILLVRVATGLALGAGRPSPWGIAGLIAGLSAVTRPTILVAAPVLLYAAFRSGRRGDGVKRALFFAAGLLVVTGAVFAWNARIGDPVLIQANGGMNFYIGNRTGGDGLASVRPGMEWNRIERLADKAGAVREVDRDRFYYKETFRQIAGDPAAALWRAMKRLLLFAGGSEVDTSQDYGYYRKSSFVLKLLFLPAAVILPFALWGVGGASRSRKGVNIPLLVLLSYLAAIVLFPYASRYRMPVFPLLALFASFTIVSLVRSFRSGRRPWKEAGGIALLFLVPNLLPVGMPEGGIVRPHLHLGKMHYDRNEPAEALAEYALALRKDRADPDLWNNIGLAREASGDTPGAREAYERSVAIAPDHGKARANLAGIFFHAGEIDSAYTEMKRAVDAEPRNPDFRNNLGALCLQKGLMEEALATLEEGARIDPDNREVLYNLARSYERVNRYDRADRVYRKLLSFDETKEVRLRLANVAEKLRRPDLAEAEYRRALALDAAYADAMRGLGVFLLREGNKKEALSLLEKYLRLRPSDERIERLLQEEVRQGDPLKR